MRVGSAAASARQCSMEISEARSPVARADAPMAEPSDDEAREQQHDDHTDDRTHDAAEVEGVVVADTEAAREDHVADKRARETQNDRYQPRLRAVQVFERVVRHDRTSDDARDEPEDQCSDHFILLRSGPPVSPRSNEPSCKRAELPT